MLEKTNSDNFDSDVLNKEKVLVEFSASWCSNSKLLENRINELNIDAYQIDYNSETELVKKYGIRFLPTVILFERGKPTKCISSIDGLEKCIN